MTPDLVGKPAGKESNLRTVVSRSFHPSSAVGRITEIVRRFGGAALFSVFMLSIAAVIDSNSFTAAERLLLWLVLPVFLMTTLAPPRQENGKPVARPPFWLARSVIFWACVIYIAVTIASTVASSDAQPAVNRPLGLYVRWGCELVLFFAVTTWLAVIYPRFFRHFTIVMVWLVAVNAAINLSEFFSAQIVIPYMFGGRLGAVFGTSDYRNATHVAPLFAIYAMAAIGLVATVRVAVWQRVLIGACAGILLAAIALTQARGAIVAVFVAVLAIAAMGSRRWLWSIVLLAVGTGAAMVLFQPLRDAMLARGGSFRTELWSAYLHLAAAQPWLGYGLDRIVEVNIRDITFEQPHNAIVWAQFRGGIFAAAAALTMVIGSLISTLRFWRTSGNAAPFVAVLVFAITAITEIGFLVYPYNWIWVTFWLPVAIGAAAEVAVGRERRLSRDPQTAHALRV